MHYYPSVECCRVRPWSLCSGPVPQWSAARSVPGPCALDQSLSGVLPGPSLVPVLWTSPSVECCPVRPWSLCSGPVPQWSAAWSVPGPCALDQSLSGVLPGPSLVPLLWTSPSVECCGVRPWSLCSGPVPQWSAAGSVPGPCALDQSLSGVLPGPSLVPVLRTSC
ncbi:unnamed protein product [Gadus morhua 'NCC']